MSVCLYEISVCSWVTALLRELWGLRNAAYLCSVSPGVSLVISETETEGLQGEARVLQERRPPACWRTRCPAPREHLPTFWGSAKGTRDLGLQPWGPHIFSEWFHASWKDMDTKAHADEFETPTFMFQFWISGKSTHKIKIKWVYLTNYILVNYSAF